MIKENIIEFIPVIRMLLSDSRLKVARLRNSISINSLISDRKKLEKILKNFALKNFIKWDGKFIFLDETNSPEEIITSFIRELEDFKANNSVTPEMIVIKDYGILAVDDNSAGADFLIGDFEKLTDEIPSQGSKTKRNTVVSNELQDEAKQSVLNQKICVVTGGAQGFGEGISRSLLHENANLIIADLNEEKGLITTSQLKELCSDNSLKFIKTDVSDPDSVKNLIFETVKNFGGIDVFISNAGILKAGGLEEMDPASFGLMTKINYEGYFLCTKYASQVMKLQSKYKEGYYSDIIQINSKSGLKGSNRNFAYSGGKFGGIGLTQSFALELAPFRVKVNAICPGNFFEGPLWSDSHKGLFVQYLKAGKVPGAKTIEDVKRFYEKQVPLGRGCRVQDVMKALVYIVSQEYETGQAVPVTGGQEMLS